MPQKKPFITLAQAKEIAADIPTPFHTLPSRPRPTPTC